ncbi:hypothetical protein ONZ45_g18632 [Pleurotus djamor]|nr:hypothetical protein ONZ45_g18632 [Pleurotus djamor]
MPGESYGNVVIGEHPTWLPSFGSFAMPKPDKVEGGVAHIETVDNLREHLQLALMVELSTIPLYLYGLYSVDPKDTTSRGVISSVAVQEMLHLVLAGNTLKAVGGNPTLYPKKGELEYWPKYPMNMAGHANPPVILNLRKPDRNQVLTYLHVELPEAAGSAPESDQYHSLGQFYKAIEGDPASAKFQFSSDDGIYFDEKSGGVVQVVDLKSAVDALEIIVEQGEGTNGQPVDRDPNELAHFFKFLTLLSKQPTTVNTVSNPITSDYKDPKIAAVAGLSDATYCLLLLTLEECWKYPNTDEHRTLLVGNVFPVMTGALKPLCEWLVTQPLGDGTFAGPPFNYYHFEEGDPVPQVQALAKQVQDMFGSDVPQGIKSAVQSIADLQVELSAITHHPA